MLVYKIIREFFITIFDEDTVHTFKTGEYYIVRGTDGTGINGWPEIYIQQYNSWFEVVLITEGNTLTDDMSGVAFMELVK